MKFSLDEPANVCVIRSYGPGYIKLSAPIPLEEETGLSEREKAKGEGQGLQTVSRSTIVLPDRLEAWGPVSFSELEKSHFQMFLELEPEVVLVGTGKHPHLPLPSLMEPLLRQRVGVEFMDTPAACRTYNILVGEGRRVLAALLMI